MALEKFEVEDRHAGTPILLNDFEQVVSGHNAMFTQEAANDSTLDSQEYA